MNTSLLNVNQSGNELDDIYGRDFYHYLRSMEFVEAFLKPIAEIVNRLGKPCLDVACGEGQLSDYVWVPYTGFDGSHTAIDKATKLRSRPGVRSPDFMQGRIEAPPKNIGKFGTVVFGGVMEVLLRSDKRVAALEMYREQYDADHAIIYDLERLDTTDIEKRFGKPLEEIHATAAGAETIEVKKHRKILLFDLKGKTCESS